MGRYRILKELGAGGMGRVYLAATPSGRAVAVKVVHPELAGDPEFRSRFRREAAARAVSGAFTAPVVDCDPDGTPPWLATAYVPGPSLSDAIRTSGPMPEPTLRVLGAGLAEALTAIHRVGLVHRDLKPSNILLALDGPRVIDFGISKAADATALTAEGQLVGTPGYMSPEHCAGAELTAASDVFSLGVVLAYAATGTPPFGTGAAHAVLYRTMHETPALDGVPRGLLGIVAACLDKDPARRPPLDTCWPGCTRRPRQAGSAPSSSRSSATSGNWRRTSPWRAQGGDGCCWEAPGCWLPRPQAERRCCCAPRAPRPSAARGWPGPHSCPPRT
ncbi:serine/threonine protein kinase [Streptacidiphilus sp. 4-A2]|nr:serine/threonine protein kinase [Streptacidiphilus sp. 4-A2]